MQRLTRAPVAARASMFLFDGELKGTGSRLRRCVREARGRRALRIRGRIRGRMRARMRGRMRGANRRDLEGQSRREHAEAHASPVPARASMFLFDWELKGTGSRLRRCVREARGRRALRIEGRADARMQRLTRARFAARTSMFLIPWEQERTGSRLRRCVREARQSRALRIGECDETRGCRGSREPAFRRVPPCPCSSWS
jgi:hypothetical protein